MRKLHKQEGMLFALLRASLHQKETETCFFEGASADDWKACYKLACQQGVMALAWDGVLKLPAEMIPPKALRITWGMAVQAYEKKYEHYCNTIQELTDFYLRRGIMTVQLKGVGLSTYYPVPSHREGGDIDIYTFSKNKEVMTDAEANLLADKLMEEQGIEVDMHSPKHSNFYYKGIPIENHKTFLDVQRYKIAGQADAWLRKVLEPQFTYLMDGEHMCLTPPKEFNTLFVAFHAAQHYAAGLALHHLCDWAMVLRKCGGKLPENFGDRKFRGAVESLTYLCNAVLGTNVKVNWRAAYLADEMLDVMLYPKFVVGFVPDNITGKWNVLKYKYRRFFYIHRLNNQALEWPMWKRVWDSVVNHYQRPETIFEVKRK